MKLIPLYFIIGFVLQASGQTFSSKWAKVPPTFKGNDARAIAMSLLKWEASIIKDQFEKTTDFEARRSDPKKVILGPGLTAENQLVFRLKLEQYSYSMPEVHYDADTEKLIINFPVSLIRYIDTQTFSLESKDIRYPSIFIAPPNRENEPAYIAQNGFGHKFKVMRERREYFKIAVDNSAAFGISGDLNIKLSMPPGQAKLVFDQLEVLFIVRLQPPFVAMEFVDVKPTASAPKDIHATTFGFVGDLQQIWIFNGATGDVYGKVIPKE